MTTGPVRGDMDLIGIRYADPTPIPAFPARPAASVLIA